MKSLLGALQHHRAAELLASVLAHPNVTAMDPTDRRIELMRLSAIALQEGQGGAAAFSVLDEADGLVARSTRPDQGVRGGCHGFEGAESAQWNVGASTQHARGCGRFFKSQILANPAHLLGRRAPGGPDPFPQSSRMLRKLRVVPDTSAIRSE